MTNDTLKAQCRKIFDNYKRKLDATTDWYSITLNTLFLNYRDGYLSNDEYENECAMLVARYHDKQDRLILDCSSYITNLINESKETTKE